MRICGCFFDGSTGYVLLVLLEDRTELTDPFAQQIYYVKATQDIPQGLDLNRTEDERFPPEKLRITIERFYTSVVVKMANFFNHVTRLRSWKEPKRTSIFCAVYTPFP